MHDLFRRYGKGLTFTFVSLTAFGLLVLVVDIYAQNFVGVVMYCYINTCICQTLCFKPHETRANRGLRTNYNFKIFSQTNFKKTNSGPIKVKVHSKVP